MLERNTLSKILAKGNARAGPHSIQEEPSGSAAAATADLQGAVKSALLHDMPEAALAGAEWERAGLTLTEAFPEIFAKFTRCIAT